jgi:hypothetical protein
VFGNGPPIAQHAEGIEFAPSNDGSHSFAFSRFARHDGVDRSKLKSVRPGIRRAT